MQKWLVEGEPIRWKILVMTQAGVFFSGEHKLMESPGDAQWFPEFSEAAERAKNIVALNFSGVTQVRIISSAFGD